MAITPDNNILLARQYRPGPDAILDEMPGGYIDLGETAEQAAARELREETGYEGEIRIVGKTWLSSNSTARRHVAVARNCYKVAEIMGDGTEHIQLVQKSVGDFTLQALAGEMTDTDLALLALHHEKLLVQP